MAAAEHGQIFQCNILAFFQTDGFIAYSVASAFFACQSFSVNFSRTTDCNILQVNSPDKGIFPVAVSEILEAVMRIRLCLVISLFGCRESGHNCSALFQIQMNLVGKPDGIAGILSCGNIYCSTSFAGSLHDSLVDSLRINVLSVAYGSKIFYVIDFCLQYVCTEKQNPQADDDCLIHGCCFSW